MSSRICVLVCISLAVTATGVPCATALATPSAELKTALEVKLPEAHIEKKSLVGAVRDLRRSLGKTRSVIILPSLGIEQITSERPELTVNVSAGTFEQQLNQLTSAYKYSWLAHGNWINLIPSDVVRDPNHVFNQGISGRVAVSKDPAKSTHGGRLAQKGFSVGVEHVGLRISKFDDPRYKPGDIEDPIVLMNPTEREVTNAHYTVYGKNLWIALLEPYPVKEGEAPGPYKFSITVYANYIGD